MSSKLTDSRLRLVVGAPTDGFFAEVRILENRVSDTRIFKVHIAGRGERWARASTMKISPSGSFNRIRSTA